MSSLRVETLESAETAHLEEPNPAGLSCQLYLYQREALGWMVARETAEEHGGVLADEVGLGKTVEIISLILRHRKPRGVRDPIGSSGVSSGATLIVTPTSIASQWVEELQKHAPGLTVVRFPGSADWHTQVTELARYDVILVTYDVLTKEIWRARAWQSGRNSRYPAFLMELSLWRVVLDEVQYAKGGRNAGKMVRMLTTQHRWAVSGTPMRPGEPRDVTQLLDFVCGATWLEAHGWEGLVRGWESDDQRRTAQLVAKLKPLFLRRTKVQCAAELSILPQRSQILYVDPTPAELALRTTFVHRSACRAASFHECENDSLSTHLQLSSLSPPLWASWGGSGGSSASLLVGELRNFTLVPSDLWKDMREGLKDAFLARRQDLNEIIAEGLKGLLPDEDDLGVMQGQAARDQQKKWETIRRCHGGKAVVLDLTLLQLLVASSTLAQLAGSQTAREAMAVLFEVLSTPPSPSISNERANRCEWLALRDRCALAWLTDSTRKTWLLGLRPHLDLEAGVHVINGQHVMVPRGMPRRWAELEPFLWLRFREYKASERLGATGDSMGYAIAIKARTPVQRPSGEVWVGQPMVQLDSHRMDSRLANASKEQAQQAVHDGFDEAKRLLCRSARGATNLPFELATNLGDAYRKRYAMRKKMVDSEEGVPGLAQGLDTYPYVMELAAESTLSDLLQLRAQALVRGWEADIRGQTRMVGPEDKGILAPLRAQRGVGTWFRPCERSIESILRPTAHSIRSLADKVRKEGERVELALSKGFANASVIAAMHRERVVEELDTMWARHKCFQTSSSKETKAAQASQVRLGNCPSSKIHAVLNLLTGQLNGQKAVIFTAFARAVPELKRIIEDKLGHEGAVVSVATLTSKVERENISKFKHDPECRILVVQAGSTLSGAGASGLTLTAARHVILMDVLPDPMVELQAIGRVHRISQKHETTVWHVVSRGSIDVVLRHIRNLGPHRREVCLRSLLVTRPGDASLEKLPALAEIDSPETQELARLADQVDEAGEASTVPLSARSEPRPPRPPRV